MKNLTKEQRDIIQAAVESTRVDHIDRLIDIIRIQAEYITDLQDELREKRRKGNE